MKAVRGEEPGSGFQQVGAGRGKRINRRRRFSASWFRRRPERRRGDRLVAVCVCVGRTETAGSRTGPPRRPRRRRPQPPAFCRPPTRPRRRPRPPRLLQETKMGAKAKNNPPTTS